MVPGPRGDIRPQKQDKVRVNQLRSSLLLSSFFSFFFPCQRWLATNEDDGQIARELVPVDPTLKKKLSRKDSMAIRNEVALETKGKQMLQVTPVHLAIHSCHDHISCLCSHWR